MPRRARLAIAGIPWHIVQRGNNRSACFFCDEDYRFYLDTLAQRAEIHGCAIHAYVLMTNHAHILLTPSTKDGPSLLMKDLGQRHTQRINRKYRRTGTLWEGRFHSCLTWEDRYVLACYRYIEMNPVRAKLVENPAAYPWSSFGPNALGHHSQMISEHGAYLALGADDRVRQSAYRGLFDDIVERELAKAIRTATHGNYALGTRKFQKQIEQMLARRASPGQPGRPRRRQ